MRIMKSFSLKNIISYHWKRRFFALPFILARNAFLLMIMVILLEIIYGEFLWYRHTVIAMMEEVKIESVATTFQESKYRSVLEEMDRRANRFRVTNKKIYPNPFVSSSLVR